MKALLFSGSIGLLLAVVITAPIVCGRMAHDAVTDTGTYWAPGGLRVAVDGVDKGPAPSDEHGTEMFGPQVPDIIEPSNDSQVDSIILGTAQSKHNPYCKNGKLVVVWEGNQPTRDGDACVWRCGP